MSSTHAESSASDERVNQIIADYLRSVERGEVPDRVALLARYPEFAQELSAFFADHDRFRRAAAPLADALTLPPDSTATTNVRPRVTYFGDYELMEEIARGGMGVVYKARQMSLNRPVALKMILAGNLATPEARQRFRMEAEAAANLQHPNIVAIHEVGEHEGQQYYSMDFVAGKNLAQVADGKPLPAQRAAAYVKTIAEAVHFAHQRGTLHRDLKPQNVLIDLEDRPRITDFGLAKRSDTDSGLTRTGDVIGSPSYMPPEQADRRPDEVGPASDVYSLGAILYELLSGRPPFRGVTAWETLSQVIQVPPVPLRKLNSEAPQDLETICQKCLEKRPERRYHSARDLAEELGRFLNHEPIHARPVSAARRASFWARRHPWVITAVVSAFVIALTLLSCGLWAENRFLVWKGAHPDYVQAPGQWTRRLEIAYEIGLGYSVCVIYVVLLYQLRRKGGWKRRLDPLRRVLASPYRPGRRETQLLIALGSMGVLYCFVWIVVFIETYVWEGGTDVRTLLQLYVLLWCSSVVVIRAVRDGGGRTLNAAVRLLPPEETDAIRRTLLAGDVVGAIKLYRMQAGNVSLADAREFIARQVAQIEAERPGEIAANARTLYGVNLKRLLLASLTGAIVLVAIVAWLPAETRVPWAFQFLACCLLGAAGVASTRLRKWFLILLISGLGLFNTIGIASNYHPEYHLSPWAMLAGCPAGAAMLYASITKRRIDA